MEARLSQSFFQRLLARLRELATARVEEELAWPTQEEELHRWNSVDGYQLIYRDEGVEEYADYYTAPYAYTDYTEEDYAQLLGEEGSGAGLLPVLGDSGAAGRSLAARGRALSLDDLLEEEQEEQGGWQLGDYEQEWLETLAGDMLGEGQEEDAEEEEWEEGEVSRQPVGVGVGVPNVSTAPRHELEKEAALEVGRGAGGDMEEEEIIDGVDVVIDRSAVELLTFRNKIGIFIGVVMIVLTISVVLVMVAVSIRRARRGKRMMKEDELSHADTVSTVLEGSCTGLPDSVYSTYIRKSSLSCDELTELDNDSFLTSLETISVMDRFAWD